MGYRIALAAEYLLQSHSNSKQTVGSNKTEESGASSSDEEDESEPSLSTVDVASLLPLTPRDLCSTDVAIKASKEAVIESFMVER